LPKPIIQPPTQFRSQIAMSDFRNNTFRFMLVDDSSIDLMINKRYLEKSGIASEIQSFLSPVSALETLLKDEFIPDIILLDIRMNEMDGFEFLSHLEKVPTDIISKINIYLVSSTLDSRDLNRAKASSLVLDIIPKPLNLDKLLSYLTKDKII